LQAFIEVANSSNTARLVDSFTLNSAKVDDPQVFCKSFCLCSAVRLFGAFPD
jgi:hypothetical protein